MLWPGVWIKGAPGVLAINKGYPYVLSVFWHGGVWIKHGHDMRKLIRMEAIYWFSRVWVYPRVWVYLPWPPGYAQKHWITDYRCLSQWAPKQYPIRHVIVISQEISKPQDLSRLLWNLAGVSAALLLRHLLNCKAISLFWYSILIALRIVRFHYETS